MHTAHLSGGTRIDGRALLAVLFVTFALGRYPVAAEFSGFTVQSWRLALIVVLFAVVGGSRGEFRSSVPTGFLALGVIWIGWGFLSMAWTPALVAGVAELSGLLMGITLAVLVAIVGGSRRATFDFLARCWLVASLVIGIAGIAEYAVGVHLPSPFATFQAENAPGTRFIAGTFANSNDLAAFLLTALPWAVLAVRSVRSRTRRCVLAAGLVLSTSTVVLSNSRLCTLGLVACGVCWMTLRKRSPRGVYRVRLLYFVGLLPILPAVLLTPLGSKLANLKSEWSDGGSLRDRFELIEHGLELTYRSNLIGVGSGGYEPTVVAEGKRIAASGDVNPHNFAIELLSQFGLLVFLLFAAWYTCLIYRLVKARGAGLRAGDTFVLHVTSAALVSVGVFVFSSSDPSSFIDQGAGWLALGSMIAAQIISRRIAAPVETPQAGPVGNTISEDGPTA